MKRKIAFNDYGFTSFLTVIFLCILGLGGGCLFLVENASALYVPSISVSTNALNSVNGNAVLNSVNKTTEIPVNLTVQTNHRTGYTATMSAETNETALVNASSANNAKINSITSPLGLANFPTNSWGYKLSTETTYSPIPGVGNPANLINTSGKTDGLDSRVINVGMNLSQNLESGRYVNKLVFSVVTNPYEKEAVLTAGPDFIQKVTALDTNQTYDVWNENMGKKENVRAFRRSHVAPAAVPANAVNVEDNASSDYEIKVWFDAAEGVMYYWAPIEKIYLNQNASRMFMHFTKLTELELSGFDTSRVENMTYMFRSLHSMKSLDLSSFSTPKLKDMTGMFYAAIGLKTLNFGNNFDTSNVVSMSHIFLDANNLEYLDLAKFNTQNVTDMNHMFRNMYALKAIKFGEKFKTNNVINMGSMFAATCSLKELDLSNFNTSKVTKIIELFGLVDFKGDSFTCPGGDKLERVYVSADFDTSKVTESFNMFAGRTKLRGGEGSFETNPSQAGIEWLKIDRPGVRGYFTNVNKRTISSLSIMQNVDAGVCANSNLHEVASLVDVRDGNTYTVAKLKDNKCWMTQNLRLVNKTLTQVDSDVSANFTVPASNLNVANTYDSSTVLPMVYFDPSKPQDGAYYNWFTATAGTGGRNIPEGADAPSSVCPSGWRLSQGGNRSEYLTLLNSYDGNVANLRSAPLNFITPGYVHERNLIGINSNGLYWSSTAGPANWAHRMSVWGNNSDQGSSWQVDGALVRCLVK